MAASGRRGSPVDESIVRGWAFVPGAGESRVARPAAKPIEPGVSCQAIPEKGAAPPKYAG
jgi:hypothetical protein